MTIEDEDLLEQQLLALGAEELRFEQQTAHLKRVAKEAVQAGQLDEADAAWDLILEIRAVMPVLEKRIMDIERVLYGMRLRRKR